MRWKAASRRVLPAGWLPQPPIVYALAPKVVVIPTFSYLGVRSLLAEYRAQGHVELRRVDITDTAQVAAAAVGADVVWVETPTNPTLDVADLPAIGAVAAAAGARDGRRLDVRHAAPAAAARPRRGDRRSTAARSSSAATATC